MTPVFFEDFPVGTQFETAARTLSRDDILAFAGEWDPQPFHLDEAAAKASPYGGIIASGFHTILVAFNLVLQARDWSQSSIGSPGMANIRWMKPVFPGDALHVRAEVTKQVASKSRPDRGFVDLSCEVINQSDDVVAAYVGTHMLRLR